jgi:hypothetical protein
MREQTHLPAMVGFVSQVPILSRFLRKRGRAPTYAITP